jgi:hypothetical protein
VALLPFSWFLLHCWRHLEGIVRQPAFPILPTMIAVADMQEEDACGGAGSRFAQVVVSHLVQKALDARRHVAPVRLASEGISPGIVCGVYSV